MRDVTIKSPNTRINLDFSIRNFNEVSDCIAYRVKYDNKYIVEWSALEFMLKDLAPLKDNFEIIEINKTSNDNEWTYEFGEKRKIRDCYNQAVICLKEKTDMCRKIDITFRIYDSGIAFCYTFHRTEGFKTIVIDKELTRFTFKDDYYVYSTYTAQGSYEKIKISELKPGVERPLVVEAGEEGPYVAIAEAKLVDYARMKLEREDSNTIVSQLTGKPQYCFREEEILRKLPSEEMMKVIKQTPFTTPWRVIIIADSPAMLYEQNDIMLNLNDPCEIRDTSFICPGKVIREITLTTEGGMACVDFAVKRNIQYVEFDAGWYGDEYSFKSDATTISIDPKRYLGPLDLKKVISYAKEKGIRVILYINHRAMVNQLNELLPLFKEWGVDGIKYGFVEVGTQRWTAWLHECIRKAAQYGFILTIHDEYRPTGYQRTYPNLLTQEGIRGDEEIQPAENTLVTVFTRMLAGPGDNTVCYFAKRVDEHWSHAYQLAKSVVIFSPLMFLYWYDKPIGSFDADAEKVEEAIAAGDYSKIERIITDEPELEFFDKLPTRWDETKVLNGEIGRYVTMARRNGEDWFLGVMNAVEEREFNIPLSFLKEGQVYNAYVYTDDESLKTRTKVKIEVYEVTNHTTFNYIIGADSGMAVRFVLVYE